MVLHGQNLLSGTSDKDRHVEWSIGWDVYPNGFARTAVSVGTTYTASMHISDIEGESRLGLKFVWYKPDGSNIVGGGGNFIDAGGSGIVEVTGIAPAGVVSVLVQLYRNNSDKTKTSGAMFRDLKLEIGDRRTPWVPSPNENYEQNFTQTSVTYAHPYAKIDDYWNRGVTGAGVKVGIVDNGCAVHPALPISGGLACGTLKNYVRNIEHGTHVAGIVLGRNLKNGRAMGVAPDAELYVIRQDYSTRWNWLYSMVEAIDYAIEQGIHILNMSIQVYENGWNWKNGIPGTPKNIRIILREAFIKAYNHGVIIVVAGGNNNLKGTNEAGEENQEFMEYLPKLPNVIAVANLTRGKIKNRTSSVGKWVDVAGFGQSIQACTVDGGYTRLSGTSMASPQVAGIFALYKQLFPDLGITELINKLFENCEMVPNVNALQQGRGVPMPPKELYDIEPLEVAGDIFRMINFNTWQAVETKGRVGNIWKDTEAKGYVQ